MMPLSLELVIRLLLAAILGAAIGYERELRAKGAGIRTHVLVALGSALFMLISQFGFPDATKFDAARVAAGVVGGVGFLGGGIIMKTNNHVTGLTTAAGIWVIGAIGLAAGCGMYEVAIASAIVALVCLEALNYYSVKTGDKEFSVVLTSPEPDALKAVVEDLRKSIKTFSLSRKEGGFKASLTIRVKKKVPINELLERLGSYPKVQLESME